MKQLTSLQNPPGDHCFNFSHDVVRKGQWQFRCILFSTTSYIVAKPTYLLSPLGLLAEQLLDQRNKRHWRYNWSSLYQAETVVFSRILSQARSTPIFHSKDKPQTFRGNIPLFCFNQSVPINQHLVSAQGRNGRINYVYDRHPVVFFKPINHLSNQLRLKSLTQKPFSLQSSLFPSLEPGWHKIVTKPLHIFI